MYQAIACLASTGRSRYSKISPPFRRTRRKRSCSDAKQCARDRCAFRSGTSPASRRVSVRSCSWFPFKASVPHSSRSCAMRHAALREQLKHVEQALALPAFDLLGPPERKLVALHAAHVAGIAQPAPFQLVLCCFAVRSLDGSVELAQDQNVDVALLGFQALELVAYVNDGFGVSIMWGSLIVRECRR